MNEKEKELVKLCLDWCNEYMTKEVRVKTMSGTYQVKRIDGRLTVYDDSKLWGGILWDIQQIKSW